MFTDKASISERGHQRGRSGTEGSITGPNIFEVVIVKVAKKGVGLGLATFGTLGKFDYGIYLKYIAKGSPAAAHGKLRLKDVLLSINDESLDNKSVDDAYRNLRNLPPGPVHLLVKRICRADNNGSVEVDGSYVPSKVENGEGERAHLASLMIPAMRHKARPRSGVIGSHKSGNGDKVNGSKLPAKLKRSNSADVNNREGWFRYLDLGNEKTNGTPPKRNSLGINYSRNGNVPDFDMDKENIDDLVDPFIVPDVAEVKHRSPIIQSRYADSAPRGAKMDKGKAKARKYLNHLPDQTKLANILSSSMDGSVGSQSGHQSKENDASHIPTAEEIPEGMKVCFVEVRKEDKASLGISLVPASEKCLGFFQVRFIFPGTPAAKNGEIHGGDYIYAVNETKLNGLSHPQAIHLLKKCSTRCQVVLLRDKDEKELLEDSMEEIERRMRKGSHEKIHILPGSIAHRSSSFSNLPGDLKHLAKTNEGGSMRIQKRVFQSKYLSNNCDDDKKEEDRNEESDDDDSQVDDICNSIPQCVSVNKRTKLGPFLIEHTKDRTSLGLDVMMDEFGQCSITEISTNGSVANDSKIRVGDVVIAINNQLLNGKPISVVKSIIRSVEMGPVQFVMKTSESENEITTPPNAGRSPSEGIVQVNIDSASVTTSSFSSEDEAISLSSVPLPPDNSKLSTFPRQLLRGRGLLPQGDSNSQEDRIDGSSVTPPPPRHIRSRPAFELVPSVNFAVKHKNMADDMSDLVSLPPAPPRPVVSNKMMNGLQHSHADVDLEDDESDMESMFSCIPAPPPPPVRVFNTSTGNLQSHINASPVGYRKILNADHIERGENSKSTLELDENDTRKSSVIDYLQTKCYNGDKEVIYEKLNGVCGERMNTASCNSEDAVINASSLQEHSTNSGEMDFTEPITAAFESNGAVSIYPEGVVIYNDKNKKKSMLSKLKSKIVLPSKSHATEYGSPTKEKLKNKTNDVLEDNMDADIPQGTSKEKKKKKKKKQRPLSATNFSDEASRNQLKLAISQPNLTNTMPYETQQVLARRKSDDTQSLGEKELNKSDRNTAKHNGSPISKKLYSRSNSKDSNCSRKSKGRNSSVASISPPTSPPPPPPSDFRHVSLSDDDTNDDDDDNDKRAEIDRNHSSIYEEISEFDLKGFGKQNGFNMLLNESCYGQKSMSDSSSSVPGSYAAFGPSVVTSANVSAENIEMPYETIGKDQLERLKVYDDYTAKKVFQSRPFSSNSKQLEGVIESLTASNSFYREANDKIERHIKSSDHSSSNLPDSYANTNDSENKAMVLTSPHPENNSSARDRLSLLHEKDKSNPKLQPFIMTEDLLNTWPSGNKKRRSHSPCSDEDDDGWGSEFSSNVLDSSCATESPNYSAYQRNDSTINKSSPDMRHGSGGSNRSVPHKSSAKDLRQFFSKIPEEEKLVQGAGKSPSGEEERQKVFNLQINNDNDQADGRGHTPDEVNPIAKSQKYDFNVNENALSHYENLENIRALNREFSLNSPPPDTDVMSSERKPLSPEEHQQLYASIDYQAKTLRRDLNETFPNNDVDEYDSDATQYSTPERNNSPSGAARDRSVEFGTYASINNIKESGRGDKGNGDIRQRDGETFEVKLLREHGKSLGISITGGSDSSISRILIQTVEDDSPASKCSIPLQAGDEILEINGHSVTGCPHSDVLRIVRESPPMIKFQVHRGVNTDLIKDEDLNECHEKVDSEKMIANLAAANHNTKGAELVSIDKIPQGTVNLEANSDLLSTGSFEVKKHEPPTGVGRVDHGKISHQLNEVFSNEAKPFGPKHNGLAAVPHAPIHLPPSGKNKKGSSNANRVPCPQPPVRNGKGGPPLKMPLMQGGESKPQFLPSTPLQPRTTKLNIDIRKEPGIGLGIAVVGGPKHIISTGIKVKRLAPSSVAYSDGRLQKDDIIVAINGNSLRGRSQGEALEMLKSIKEVVVLTVHRPIGEYVKEGQNLNNNQQEKPVKPRVVKLKKSNSEIHLSAFFKGKKEKSEDQTDNTSRGRKFHRGSKEVPTVRSHSEPPLSKEKKTSTSSNKTRSPGFLRRLFRSSSRILKKDKDGKEKHKELRSETNVADSFYTIYFERTFKPLDFTLVKGGEMYGDGFTVVQSISEGSELNDSLHIGDRIASINNVSLQSFSDSDLKKFLSSLPKRRIAMVVQR